MNYRIAALATCLLVSAGARAQSADSSPASPPEAASVERGLVPPRALGSLSIAYPAAAPARSEPVAVKVLLTIGIDGAVTAVQLAEGAGEPFDGAVLEAAKSFRFEPARMDGKPVEVMVPFTQTFLPPPPPSLEAENKKLDALLEGLVVERGSRRPVPLANLMARDREGEHFAISDEQGRFSLAVASGEVRVQLAAAGLRPFSRIEVLRPDEQLKVKYLVERESLNPYESVVVGTRERTEISRTTLSGRELHQMPGTMGDPMRTVTVLPGVTQVMSLLPIPMVRGSSPGDTGIFLDGARLPLLFHLFGGPSVIHPEFIDRIDFYPGGFPVSYGGYTGGIIDGQTVRPKLGENKVDLDLNLLQTGFFVRQQVPGTDLIASIAGRYGYPSLVLKALTPDLGLSYWDYQARLDGGSPKSAWSVFAYGAQDVMQMADSPGSSSMTTELLFHFHRLDLKWKTGTEEQNGNYRVLLGYDETQLAAGAVSNKSVFVDPQVSWSLPLASWLRVRAGGEALLRESGNPPEARPVEEVIGMTASLIQTSGRLFNVGAFLEAPVKPSERLLVVPGVRYDHYRDDKAQQRSLDPRLTLRCQPLEASELWLKAMVGRYHQPPRVFLPVPGADQASLELGLLVSTQYGAGVEVGLAPGIDLDVQGYYNAMNPVVFDLSINTLYPGQTMGPSSLPGQLPSDAGQVEVNPLTDALTKRRGRSYGLEVLLRKRDAKNVFGWLAYTLSHSERDYEKGWAPFDFDRTHMFNAVAGIRLPRNWEIGGRLLLQSGTPLNTIQGTNAGRADWQFRADLRVDKRAVWNSWLLDFYVDIVNATVSEESGGVSGGSGYRYVLPTIGLRGGL